MMLRRRFIRWRMTIARENYRKSILYRHINPGWHDRAKRRMNWWERRWIDSFMSRWMKGKAV